MNRRECLAHRADESHLFACPACRGDARIAAAWKDLPLREAPVAADERLIAAILENLEHDDAERSRSRLWLAAAAAALFFFFTGLALESSSKPAAAAEESYASLASPSALEGLMPN